MSLLRACAAAAAAAGAALAQPVVPAFTPVWSARGQPARDNQATSASTGVFGPPSGGGAVAVAWTNSFVPSPLGVSAEVVSDTNQSYALSSYTRGGSTTISALLPSSGATVWSTAVPHGAFYYAAAGLTLTAYGSVVSHAVANSWQAATALSVVDGSTAWVYNTSVIYDHVTIDPAGATIYLTDYFGNATAPPGIVLLDASAGGAVKATVPGVLCVSPLVTVWAIVCFCDGDRYAHTLCGYARGGSSATPVAVVESQ
jgi:hypothetical protein